MAPGEQSNQHFFDDVVLADDDLTDLAEHAVALVCELFDLRDLVLFHLRCFHGLPSRSINYCRS